MYIYYVVVFLQERRGIYPWKFLTLLTYCRQKLNVVVMCCPGVCQQNNSVTRNLYPDVAEDVGEFAVGISNESWCSAVVCRRVCLLPSVPDGHPRFRERDACKAAHAHDGHERNRILV